jgi:short subunit fatty acids transporter
LLSARDSLGAGKLSLLWLVSSLKLLFGLGRRRRPFLVSVAVKTEKALARLLSDAQTLTATISLAFPNYSLIIVMMISAFHAACKIDGPQLFVHLTSCFDTS